MQKLQNSQLTCEEESTNIQQTCSASFEVESRFKRHFGNNFVCLFIGGEPLLTLGPHCNFNYNYFEGPLVICMILTFGCSSYLLLAFVRHYKSPIWFKLSLIVAVIQLGSYLLCAFKNPGILTAKERPNVSASLSCNICKVTRQIGRKIQHCEDCNVCILDLDHHCPWTGKCVGAGNITFFYVFVTMIPVYIIFFIIVSMV